MKKALIIAGSLLALIVIALLAVPLLVDAEKLRPMVESQAKAALGREVKVGKLDLSLLRGAVVASDVTVSDDPAFSKSPFMTAKALRIGVELMPYITSNEVKVTSISVEEPKLQLVRTAAGKWNFESIGRGTAADTGKPSATQAFTVQNLKIENGSITMRKGKTAHTYEEVNAEITNFSMKSAFPFTAAAKSPGGGSFEIAGTAGPLDAGEMMQTPLDATIHIKAMDIASTGMLAPGSAIAGKLDYDGKIKSDGKVLHTEGKATTSNLKVVRAGTAAKTPVTLDYASDLDLVTKRGIISRGDILIGETKAKLTGTYDTKGDSPILNARFKGSGMSLNALQSVLPAFGVMMPQGTNLQGGVVNADLALQGPVDRLVTTGPISVANAKLAGFNLKSRASGVGALAGLPSGSDLLIQALNSRLRVAPEGIRAEGISVVLPNVGMVTGDGIIGAKNDLNFKMKAKLTGGGGLIGGVSTLTSLGQSKGEIPFLIQGTTDKPVFLPDMAGAMGNTVRAPVQGVQGIGGALGGLFGKKR